jgi:SagB-type dehydrogenase family enzyme
MDDRIGDEYQRRTKYTRESLRDGFMLDWDSKPPTYKEYPRAPRLELPTPAPRPTMDLDRALRERRSVRDFTPQALPLEDLSYLVWASTGIQRREEGYAFRTAPSAGALYPIETYVSVQRVEDVASGLYHYAIEPHALEELKQGDQGREVARGALGQGICAEAAAVFLWTAVFHRSKWKYRQRAYRYVYLDAGHVAENLYLAATALGLGCCTIGALFDDDLNALLGVDGEEESVLYLAAVGHPDN